MLNSVDTNKDGKISQSEFMTACQKGELKEVQLNDENGMINSKLGPPDRAAFFVEPQWQF